MKTANLFNLEGMKMSTTNKEKFAQTYAQAFVDSYPQFDAARQRHLIEKAIGAALADIRSVSIDGAAFKLTAKRLGIKCTYKAFDAFLNS